MRLIQLVYTSEPVSTITQNEIDNIVTSSQVRNRKSGITGALYYNRKHYFQCLEGGRTAVNQLYNKIVSDPRHHNCRMFLFRDINQRDFTDWDMAYIGEGIKHEKLFHRHSTMPTLELDAMSGETALMLLKALHAESG